jgi:hypothetical protein
LNHAPTRAASNSTTTGLAIAQLNSIGPRFAAGRFLNRRFIQTPTNSAMIGGAIVAMTRIYQSAIGDHISFGFFWKWRGIRCNENRAESFGI